MRRLAEGLLGRADDVGLADGATFASAGTSSGCAQARSIATLARSRCRFRDSLTALSSVILSRMAAFRAVVGGKVQGVGFRDATVRRARELGVLGWVRNEDDGTVRVHAEGPDDAVAALRAFLGEGPRGAAVDRVEVSEVGKAEGHEQFAVRGVPAGEFLVVEHQATTLHYDLRLEVDGVLRSWAVPKEPSTDPKVKRLAVQVGDHTWAGAVAPGATVWDRGSYEQGGRVAWPEALERGHAVFVLHGSRLRGGYVLQRTRGDGPKSTWLLFRRQTS